MINRQRLFTALITLIALAITLTLMAGCGDGDTATAPQEQSHETTPVEPAAPTQGKVLVVVADSDVNETECNAVLQVLSGDGYDLVVANASGEDATGDRGNVYPIDIAIAETDPGDYEAMVLVGGTGMIEYFEHPALHAIVQEMDAAGKTVAAICIAPVILANAGILQGVEATVSSSRRDALADAGAVVVDEPVVADGNIITGWGPDAADEFAQEVRKALGE
ncbi:MAG: DJ-1/PfpI family protein [Actinobacteria bacterium]|nr:DJ-1/PfpI family protein [Actinomycetota bacterium]